MPVFEYQALDAKRKAKKGILEADTGRHARNLIREQGLLPTEVRLLEDHKLKKAKQETLKSNPFSGLFSKRIKLSAKETVTVTRQLANLIEASLPIDEALRSIAEHNNANIRRLLSSTRSQVVEGRSLSQSLQEQRIFDPQYAASIAAGEQSGKLARVLHKMADDTERSQQFYSKMKTAMIYPSMIATVALSVVIALLTFVVPQVVEVFVNTNRDLPTLTVIMIDVSDFLKSKGQLLLVMFLAAFIIFRLALRVKRFKRGWHRLLTSFPVIGKIFLGTNNSRFCRTFSLLQAAGVPVIETMRLSANIVTSLPMQEGIIEASEMVREGSSIFRALEKKRALPEMTLYMLASGESSGNIPEMLERSAINQEQELENFSSTLLAIVEPLIILIMGGIVLMIVLSILLPIFELNQVI